MVYVSIFLRKVLLFNYISASLRFMANNKGGARKISNFHIDKRSKRRYFQDFCAAQKLKIMQNHPDLTKEDASSRKKGQIWVIMQKI